MLHINAKKIKNGIRIKFKEKNYDLLYPKEIWYNFSEKMKDFLLDNISFLTTFHLPIYYDENGIIYNTNYPLLKPFFKEVQMHDIPLFCDKEKKDTTEMIKNFFNIEYFFNENDVIIPTYETELEEKAIINFTFGKESLLTFGICREIGLETELIYFQGLSSSKETRLKRFYAKKFSFQFNQNIIRIKNILEYLTIPEYLKINRNTNWGNMTQLTEYCLASLPIVDFTRSKFILFGNEKSCDNFFYNRDGYKTYPVFDQSSKWTLSLNNMMKVVTGSKTSVFTIVEPLNEIAIMKILHNRYKDLGRFQFSCFVDEFEFNEIDFNEKLDGRWCHICSKCARIYLFFKALGIDPRIVGFQDNLFRKKYLHNFSLFNGKQGNTLIYDYSGLGRDEQLFAFYLAFKRGERGKAIELFKQKYLDEVKQREDELYKEFFGVFDSITMPKNIKSKVISIFKEELSNGFE